MCQIPWEKNWDPGQKCVFHQAIGTSEFTSASGNPGVICYSVMKLDRDFVKLLQG